MTARIDREINLWMDLELASDFQELCDTTGHSRGAIFQKAINLYKVALENKHAGGNLIKRCPDGTLTEIVGL